MRQNSGFTLVEILVTLALSTVIALAASSLMIDITKGQIKAQNLESSLGFMNLVRQSISSDDNHCITSLANTVITSPIAIDIPLKLTIAGKPIEAGTNNVFGGVATDPNRIQINSVQLKNVRSVSISNGGQSLIGSLEISATRFEGNSGFLKIYKIGGLMLNLDSTLKITGCTGLTESKLEDTCISIGAIWSNIDQVCKPNTPSCPPGSMVILNPPSTTPSCLDFKVYLASLCAPGESLKTNIMGTGILCSP